MPKSVAIEQMVYQYMCVDCEHEHYCHNACENCEEYEDELDRLYKERIDCNDE